MYIYRLSNWIEIVADISHKDLLESLGNTAAGFTKNLANQAANFACDLYNRYPWALTFGDTGNFSKGVWDELCRQRPSGLPSAPTALYSGGQCDLVLYEVTITWNQKDGVVGSHSPGNFWGPIKSVEFVQHPSNRENNQGFLQELWMTCRGSEGNPRPLERLQIAGSYTFATSILSVSLRRIDGKPDNCGDLPSDYPKTPVPPGDRLTLVNINIHGGTAYNIPLMLQFSTSKYNIQVDAGDISFVFDLVGVTVNSNPVNKTIKNIEYSVIDLAEDVANLAQIVTPFINNSVNFNSSFNVGVFQTTEDSGSSSPADEEQSDNIAYVTLDITRKPVNAKTQEGELAQDLLYAGWFQFAAKGYYFPREPIHFSKAIFKAPYGATDYAYTLYEGFEAKVVAHRI